MNNPGMAFLKLAALATGAVAGALLSRWVDEARQTRASKRPDYHKTRYSQGLAPMDTQLAADEQ